MTIPVRSGGKIGKDTIAGQKNNLFNGFVSFQIRIVMILIITQTIHT
jgi:hypothetical protein